MNHEFLEALEQIEREKGISKELLLDAIETALASAYKRDQKAVQSIEVRLDQETGALRVFTHKTVVEEVEDDKNEINLADAQQIDPIYEMGDLVAFEISPKDFGRIAAQTAKQVVVQRIREAERSIIYEEFTNRTGDLITGVIQRFEQRNIFIDLGRIEGILPANEQMPNERYEPGQRIKTFVVEVKKTTKGPQVLLSRSRTGLLKRLFELEVPEIQDGLVEIKAVAREPGHRSKMAVSSRDSQIDPVGACVGSRGIRVQMIVRELKGEKIDIVPWSDDTFEFIVNAMSPAKVSDVKLLPSKKTAMVIVPDFQLSLAIGKEGQNARLAAKLTGWKIDIKSETQATEQAKEIDRLIADELGLRGPDEEPEEAAIDIYDELGLEPVKSVIYKGDEAEEAPSAEEEEVVAKKKTKKAKPAKKPAKIELDDEPISLEEGIFFSDVLEERKTAKESGEPKPAAKVKAKDKAKAEKELVTAVDDGGGFTIGQLLGAGLAKGEAQERQPVKKGAAAKTAAVKEKTAAQAKAATKVTATASTKTKTTVVKKSETAAKAVTKAVATTTKVAVVKKTAPVKADKAAKPAVKSRKKGDNA
jgi:N utilization substance protein A